jgi:hypothetical protein
MIYGKELSTLKRFFICKGFLHSQNEIQHSHKTWTFQLIYMTFKEMKECEFITIIWLLRRKNKYFVSANILTPILSLNVVVTGSLGLKQSWEQLEISQTIVFEFWPVIICLLGWRSSIYAATALESKGTKDVLTPVSDLC